MTIASTPWLQRAFERAMDAHAAGRLPHALLICGPERLGKRDLAGAIAQRLLCRQASATQHACGSCRGCTLFAAGTHPDHRNITFGLNDKGEPRTEITVDQMRALGEALVLTPQLGGAQVVVLHPAETLNRSAFNALLKTLEEPPPGRFLILVSDQPYRLPATIRSRCQRLDVKLPPIDEARAWLLATGASVNGASVRQADAALAVNLGHPGLARRDLQEDGLALRTSVAKDLAALAAGRERAMGVAQRWIEDRARQRLQIAAECLRDYAAQRARGEVGASRLALAGLPQDSDPRPLAVWFDEANRAQTLLSTTLRQDLLLGELLRLWCQASGSAAATVLPAPGRR